MLSLKSQAFQHLAPSSRNIEDLPNEILDIVLEYVFGSSVRNLGSIIPASLSCKHLRRSANPILFRDLTLLGDDTGIRPKSHRALRQLLESPHILKHVRQIQIRLPLNAQPSIGNEHISHKATSLRVLEDGLNAMTGLRRVRIDHISELSTYVLGLLRDRQGLQVSFMLSRITRDCCTQTCNDACREIASAARWECDIAFPGPIHIRSRKACLEFLERTDSVHAVDFSDLSTTVIALSDRGAKLDNVEELHIASTIITSFESLILPNFISWQKLQRLHLEGDRQVKLLLPAVAHELQNLTTLRLQPSTTLALHPNCPESHEDELTGAKPHTTILSLQHLELFSVCNHLKISQLTVPTLKSLKMQMPEFSARISGHESVRHSSDIKELARCCPLLERLEIHVGGLENLWNPSAIIGVDVDPEVYQLLTALARFKNLRILRLFPHYVPRDTRHDYLNAKQPLSDEQAVRLFRHLCSQGMRLQLLSIGATFETLRFFSPMSWTVRSSGQSKTILTTRQAGKDYEIEQVWLGERRMTTRNKRHTYRKPYLPDLGDWTFPLDDLNAPIIR